MVDYWCARKGSICAPDAKAPLWPVFDVGNSRRCTIGKRQYDADVGTTRTSLNSLAGKLELGEREWGGELSCGAQLRIYSIFLYKYDSYKQDQFRVSSLV